MEEQTNKKRKRKVRPAADGAGNESAQPPEMMRLVGDLSRLFHREIRKVCEENGVPSGYRGLLFHLARENGVCQRDLAEKTGLKASTVSITLDKMERDGFVLRKRDEKDGRAMRVYLTEKGLDIDRKNRKKIAELETRFSSLITAEERDDLSALLIKVIDGYRALSGEEPEYKEKRL